MKKSLSNIMRTGLLALATVMTAALTACSGDESDLMQTIPYNSTMVVLFHPQDIVEKVDINEYIDLMGTNAKLEDFLDAVKKGKSGIDLQSMAIFTYDINKPVMTFLVTDEDDFERIMDCDRDKVGGMSVYNVAHSSCIVVNDGQAWFFMSGEESGEAVRKVKKFQDLDKDESVLSVEGFKDSIVKGDASMYINIKQLIKSEGAYSSRMLRDELEKNGLSYDEEEIKALMQAHVFASLTIEQDQITLEARALNDNGKSIATRYSDKTVNPDILGNFDKSATLVMATVLPEQSKKIIAKFVEQGGSDAEIFGDLLDRTKDNVAMSVTLAGNLITEHEYNYYNWDTGEYELQTRPGFNKKSVGVTLAIEGKSSMQPVIDRLAQMGVPKHGDELVIPDSKTEMGDIAARSVGNYLIISNRQAPNNKLSDTGMFKGKTFAAILNLSKTSTASKAVKDACGVEVDILAEAWCDSEKAVIKVKTPSSKEKKAKSALDYLIKLGIELSKVG